MKTKPIYKQELEEVFRYWEDSNILERRLKIINTSISTNSTGYVLVRFGARMILAHRIIYTLTSGDIPENMHVDHIDNDKTNNDISNLQLLTHQENLSKSLAGLAPCFHKQCQSFQVQERAWFREKRHNFSFGSFKIESEALDFCTAYNNQFGLGRPQYSARTRTPEHWRACMINFKNFYFNTQEKYA